MNALAVVVAVFVVAVDPVAVDPAVVVDRVVVDPVVDDPVVDDPVADCVELRALVAGPATVEGVARGAQLVQGGLGARLVGEVGRTSLEGAWRLLAQATTLRCVDDGGADVDLSALAADPRFSGVRNDDDVGDQLLDRLLAWLEALLESEAMIAFSEQTRTVYLTGLAVVALVVGWRLRRRRLPTIERDDVAGILVERRRALAFVALRDDAVARLAGEPRAAMILLRQALLARIGEIDADAARPSRTASEVLARLTSTTADTVAPALLYFDARFYAGGADVDGATTLLQLVDDGAARLEARR